MFVWWLLSDVHVLRVSVCQCLVLVVAYCLFLVWCRVCGLYLCAVCRLVLVDAVKYLLFWCSLLADCCWLVCCVTCVLLAVGCLSFV